jgi:GntR family transcriptional regulator
MGRGRITLALSEDGSGVTLYARIASILRSKIVGGVWSVGDLIPTIEELSVEYGAAKITIRQAVRLLANEGLLQSFRGRGTFVSGIPTDFPQGKVNRIVEARSEYQKRFKSLARTTVTKIPPLLNYGTGIATGSFKYIRRLHYAGKRPLFVIDLYIDKSMSDRLSMDWENIVSVVHFLNKKKIEIEVETTVTVGTADAEMSKLLQCAFASATAQVVRLVVDKSGKVMLASIATYPAELFAMQTVHDGPTFLKARRGSSIRNIV